MTGPAILPVVTVDRVKLRPVLYNPRTAKILTPGYVTALTWKRRLKRLGWVA